MAERPRAERAAGVLNRPQAAWENRASCLEEVAGEKAQWLNVTPAGRHREEPPPAEAQERETPGHQENAPVACPPSVQSLASTCLEFQ